VHTVPSLEVSGATCKQYVIVMPVQATKATDTYYFSNLSKTCYSDQWDILLSRWSSRPL